MDFTEVKCHTQANKHTVIQEVIKRERNNIYHQNSHKWRIPGIIPRGSKEDLAGTNRTYIAGHELRKSCRIGSRKEDKLLRTSITAAVIAAFEIMITLDQWEGISKIITAAVVFWGMNLFLLLGMEGEDAEDHQGKPETSQRKRRAA